jgi:signal transduction histidine kinase
MATHVSRTREADVSARSTTSRTADRTPEAAGEPTSVAGAPPPTRAAAPPVGAAVLRALDDAAAQVCAEWELSTYGPVSAADLRVTAAGLCEGVRRLLEGRQPEVAGLPPLTPVRRVLEEIRRSFLGRADDMDGNDAARQILRVVGAMERLQKALDLDSAHRFTSRLSGADAQQLVVEIAHDMRSPLGSILILAERLRYGGNTNLTPVQERQLGLVYSAAFGLSSLAGDVIELARGGATLVDQRPMPFSVSDVLQSILDILRPMAEEKSIAIRGSGPEADVRIGFQAALNRVLLNLATNALKFTNAGSVDILCRQIDRTRIEFSVRDTGRGIPPHVLSSLFEAFRQRQITGDYAFSSAGLGLSICHKLVLAMGGELKVETELEKGTRFSFELDLPQPSRL